MIPLTDAESIQVNTYAQVLRGGGVVAFPTETVYGLGASARNPAAVKRIFELKGRPEDNPLIVHVSTYAMVLEFAAEIPENARVLMQKFWPGPLTLIFDKRKEVLDLITGGLSSVAIRMPDNNLALALLNAAGPLVAPSANKSGRPSPTKAEHVTHDFGGVLPVFDGGKCNIGLESTVLDVRQEPFRILRPGSVTANLINQKTGLFVMDSLQEVITEDPMTIPESPGTKYTHYAPDTPVRWMTDEECAGNHRNDILYLRIKFKEACKKDNVICFDNNLEQMARELYDWFRRSDDTDCSEVAIEPFEVSSDNTLSVALYNRISKAIKK
ncbi:MAG: threonylcarbamoyl-AMP synthase [Bacteroidetes bacterium]|nr:threonylcarbamoyl-AMP synthase [Bacteroidota bacterium]